VCSELSAAFENTADPTAAVKVVRKLRHERRIRELEEAKKLATYRSGARGLKARKELRQLEEELKSSLAL
jgi:ATP-binding cassette subfamily F protein 3